MIFVDFEIGIYTALRVYEELTDYFIEMYIASDIVNFHLLCGRIVWVVCYVQLIPGKFFTANYK